MLTSVPSSIRYVRSESPRKESQLKLVLIQVSSYRLAGMRAAPGGLRACGRGLPSGRRENRGILTGREALNRRDQAPATSVDATPFFHAADRKSP